MLIIHMISSRDMADLILEASRQRSLKQMQKQETSNSPAKAR